MKFILLRYGYNAIELHIEDVERITSEDDILKVYYHSGQVITGHMIKVES